MTPTDGRAVLIGLTPAGADLLDRRREARTARLTAPLAQLDDDEARRVADALPALARLVRV